MSLDQIFVLILLAIVFVGFFKETYPPEITALAASAALLVMGIIDTNNFLKVFSSSAPITIAMMFIISAALERTGMLMVLGDYLKNKARGSYPRTMMIMIFGTVTLLPWYQSVKFSPRSRQQISSTFHAPS